MISASGLTLCGLFSFFVSFVVAFLASAFICELMGISIEEGAKLKLEEVFRAPFNYISSKVGLKRLKSKLETKMKRRREIKSDILLLMSETELDEKFEQLEEAERVVKLEDHK